MKKAKNFCAVLFCMIFILTGLPVLALSAEAAPTVTMTKTTDYKNGTVTIDVYVDKAELTDAYALNIEYDALSFKEYAAGNEDDIAECNSGTQGILKIGIFRMIKDPTLNAKIISLTFLLNSGYYGFVQSGEVRLTGTATTNDYSDGIELTPQTITVDLHCPHTRGEAQKENVVDAKCEVAGSYDEVVYCTVCDKELTREAKTIDALRHELAQHPASAPDCLNDGNEAWEDCHREGCGYTTYQSIPALGHSFTKENADIQYLKTPATCTAAAEYYKSCIRCDLSSKDTDGEDTFVYGVALDHTLTEWVVTKDATCTAEGEKMRHCENCDFVETAAVEKTAHADADKDGKCDECGGDMTSYCKHMCHSTSKFTQFFWKIIRFFQKLFRIKQECACGVKHW